MCSKIAIVTGSNKGIGYAIVKSLCEQFDGDVYLTARDIKRGETAVESLKKLGLKPKFHQLDITDEASIAKFKTFIEENYSGINVLINNAAILKFGGPELFGLEAEETLHVNYFCTKKLCNALFPLLLPGARVVNLSSSSGHLSNLTCSKLKKKFCSSQLTIEELDTLMQQFIDAAKMGTHEQYGWPNRAYTVSKVGISALTFIQQKAFDVDSRKDIVVNCVHPGYVATDMTKPMTVTSLAGKTLTNIERGAEAPVYLALLPNDEQNIKGQYVWSDRTIKDWYN